MKPKCKLIGTDGNVFALAGRVTEALRRSSLPDKVVRIHEFKHRLTECPSYDAALRLMQEYVEVS